jgi:3-deoxy-D-manno-octulosonic-acid transferase
VHGCRRRGIPLVLANARFNAQSLRKAQRLGWLARPAYASLAAVWAQTEGDAQRLRAIGAPVQAVLGNLKFDLVPDASQVAQGQAWRAASTRPVVMLASSREGEEALWLEKIKQKTVQPLDLHTSIAIKNVVPDAAPPTGIGVQWLIVPRHPQRFAEVQQLLQAAGLRVSRRSTWAQHPPQDTDVWLGDSLGEMPLYYGLADVALLGGSFAPLGGQNLIEAAACGCPVVLGPHTFNFAEAADNACEAGAAQRVPDMAQGIAAACSLACTAPHLAQAQARARRFAQSHQGAAQATATAVAQHLKPR